MLTTLLLSLRQIKVVAVVVLMVLSALVKRLYLVLQK